MNDSSHCAVSVWTQPVLTLWSLTLLTAAWLVAVGPTLLAQELVIPESSQVVDGGTSQSYQGGGSFFSPSLNTHLRARYSTQSYGQGEGNFDLGTMKLFDLGDAAAFIDGQVTMNDVDGVGYNVGIGYRWLWDQTLPLDPEPMRVVGVSLWSDGSSTLNKHFFSQIGVSFEALGDLWDFRMNGYVPLGDSEKTAEFTNTGNLIFMGNGLAQQTSSPSETALTVGEFELARRLGNRDAWAFGGVYGMAGGGFDSATGYKAGLRGYIFPDLLMQIAVTDDEMFDTNAVFSVVWFIGRTRDNDCATCSVSDRLREPVMRNDYVAVAHSTTFSGTSLTDTQDSEFRFVHVDSNAASGGDGTFENPFSNMSPVFAASQEGDTIYMHGGSQFVDTSLTLQNSQQLLGEGNNIVHQVATTQLGTVALPETATGASSLATPRIQQTGAGTTITLARDNTVNNLHVDGGTVGIDGTNSTSNPTLRNLEIENTTGDGITLQAFARNDAADDDNDTNTTEIEFDVTIDQVTFDNIGGNDISIDADSGVDPTLANTDLNETINVSNITSTNGTGDGIQLRNTHAGGTALITSASFDGNSNGVDIEEARGSVTANTVTVANSTSDAVRVANSTDVSFGTLDIDNAGARGVNFIHTDAQAFGARISGSDINGATLEGVLADARGTGLFDVEMTGTVIAGTLADGFLADLDGTANAANIEVTSSTITVADNSAFRIIGDQTTSNNINFLLSGNTFTNTSNSATTVDLDVNSFATLNSTVLNNTLLNNGTASELSLDTNHASATARLRMTGNSADAGAGDFDLTNTFGTFTVDGLLSIGTDNTGTVNQSGVIGVDAGNIPTP